MVAGCKGLVDRWRHGFRECAQEYSTGHRSDLGVGAKRPPHGGERRLENPPGEGFRRERAEPRNGPGADRAASAPVSLLIACEETIVRYKHLHRLGIRHGEQQLVEEIHQF
jgi:hypothetical protein